MTSATPHCSRILKHRLVHHHHLPYSCIFLSPTSPLSSSPLLLLSSSPPLLLSSSPPLLLSSSPPLLLSSSPPLLLSSSPPLLLSSLLFLSRSPSLSSPLPLLSPSSPSSLITYALTAEGCLYPQCGCQQGWRGWAQSSTRTPCHSSPRIPE